MIRSDLIRALTLGPLYASLASLGTCSIGIHPGFISPSTPICDDRSLLCGSSTDPYYSDPASRNAIQGERGSAKTLKRRRVALPISTSLLQPAVSACLQLWHLHRKYPCPDRSQICVKHASYDHPARCTSDRCGLDHRPETLGWCA